MGEPAPDVVQVEGVTFQGAFTPVEREFLAAQFGACRFRLISRSTLGASLALVEWEGGAPGGDAPRPIATAPRRATYVLGSDDAGTSAGAAGASPGGRWPGMSLERVDGARELAARFPDHFPAARVSQDWRERLRLAVRDVWPALMLAVATLWVLAVAWACRSAG